MNNIFLTGERGIGKSTIINGFVSTLDFLPAGFQTRMLETDNQEPDSVIIRPYKADSPYMKGATIGKDEAVVATRDNNSATMKIDTNAFDVTGAKILRMSREQKNPRLIIMDELGFMESEAHIFRSEVLKCLDEETPVFGVLKAGTIPFLDSIRKRDDVLVFEVTEENRDRLIAEIIVTIKICL